MSLGYCYEMSDSRMQNCLQTGKIAKNAQTTRGMLAPRPGEPSN